MPLSCSFFFFLVEWVYNHFNSKLTLFCWIVLQITHCQLLSKHAPIFSVGIWSPLVAPSRIHCCWPPSMHLPTRPCLLHTKGTLVLWWMPIDSWVCWHLCPRSQQAERYIYVKSLSQKEKKMFAVTAYKVLAGVQLPFITVSKSAGTSNTPLPSYYQYYCSKVPPSPRVGVL